MTVIMMMIIDDHDIDDIKRHCTRARVPLAALPLNTLGVHPREGNVVVDDSIVEREGTNQTVCSAWR